MGSLQGVNFALDPAHPLPDEIRRVARETLDDAIARLSDGEEPFAARVHESRKRTKELRALLRLVRAPLGADVQSEENRRLRDAARALAPARDAEVACQTLGSVDGGASDLARLREELDGRRRSARASVAGARVADAVAGELAGIRDRVAAWELAPDDWALIGHGVRRGHRRARRRLRAAAAQPSDVAMHEWRKRVKDHWYHLRLLTPAFPGPLEALAEEAHRLSDALGDDHDLAVLAGALDEVDVTIPDRARRRLDERIVARRGERRQEAWEIGERLYAAKPGDAERLLRSWWEAARRAAAGG